MATLKDIAKVAGVNISTVSKALRDSTDINEQTKLNIRRIADELDYKYEVSKIEILNEQTDYGTNTIGIICPEITSNYYSEIISIIAKETRKEGYFCVFGFTDFEPEVEELYLRDLLNTNVKGIIFISESLDINKVLSQYKENHNTPLVLITPNTETKDFDCIRIDDDYGVRLAIEHLVQQGHTDIGYIGDELSNPRLETFLKVMRDYKLKINKKWIQVSEERFERCGYELMSNLLKEADLPTAFLGAYDDIVIGAVKAIHDGGLRVPDDISMIGIDNIRVAGYFDPAITSIAGPVEEMGRIALKLLFKKIKSPEYNVVQNVILSPTLITRKSVKKIL